MTVVVVLLVLRVAFKQLFVLLLSLDDVILVFLSKHPSLLEQFFFLKVLHRLHLAGEVLLGYVFSHLLLVLNFLLLSLVQDVKLLMDFVFVAINNSLSVHGVFVLAVSIVVVLVCFVLDLEIVFGVVLKDIYDKRPLALVLFHHGEDEVLHVLGVSHLERKRLLVKYLVHQALDALVIERNLQSSHLVHHHAQAEDVGAVVVGFLLYDLWT